MYSKNLAEALKQMILSPVEEIGKYYKEIQGYINNQPAKKQLSLSRAKVKSVKMIKPADNEYVYDIGMKNTKHPWFFGNNVLVHNSCYFSAYPILKNEIEKGEIIWTKESMTDMYNELAKSVSSTFPEFLLSTFNVPVKRSTGVIASSRETISESGIWMVKKRYACLMFDKDGIRQDVGRPGKLKAMGLDLKRADTPKFVQEFLSEILMDTLCGKGEKEVIEKIRNFKEKFADLKPWQQGTPRAVNKLSHYKEEIELANIKRLKGETVDTVRAPGHVTASLAWNRLRDAHMDQHSMKIIDGQKIIVCKLLETSENKLSSIAYPVDQAKLPDWFISLPFDLSGMLASVVDKKIENLLGVLDYDLKAADNSTTYNSLFE